MTDPKIIVPIIKENMIAPAKEEGADILYVDYKQFVKNNRFSKAQLIRYIKIAHSLMTPIFLSFGPNIYERDLPLITSIVEDLSQLNIDGIMINDFSILQILKEKKHKRLRLSVILDSGLNIHNIAGCDLFKKWRAKSINITEEIYLKNVTRIKKYTGKNICINLNEAIWLYNYAVNWGIDMFKIMGTYEDIPRICLLISLIKDLTVEVKKNKGVDNIKIEQIINLMDYSNPQRHYQTDHFTRTFKDVDGKDFEFTGNIKMFNWDENKVVPHKTTLNKTSLDKKGTKLRVRLTRMEHFKAIEEYLSFCGNNFIDIIEFGDIIYPSDLAKESYEQIIKKVKEFCLKHEIKLYLTTPRILIERDFERVTDTVKWLCFKNPRPEGIVINNLGLWKTVSMSKKLRELNIELGYGLNILNSKTIELFESTCPVSGVDLESDQGIDNIEQIIKNIDIPTKSLMILGTSKLHTSGLCPLNSDIAVVSRLSCKAPCQKASYAIVDPFTNEMLPMVLDGFCRFHLVNSYIEDRLKNINKYISIGITDFVVDFSALPAEMISPLLDRYCLAFDECCDYDPIESKIVRYEPKVFSQK